MGFKRWRHCVAVTVLTVLLPAIGLAQAPAKEKEIVAVLDLEPLESTKVQAAAFTDRVREELVASGLYTLVDRNQLNAVLDEQALQQTGCTSQECAVKVGKILGVRKLVTGRLTKVDADLWQVSAQMLDVETAATVRQVSIQHVGPYRSLLLGGAGTLVAKLIAVPGSAGAVQQPGATGGTPAGGADLSLMPTARAGAAAGVVGGVVYVAGGERDKDRLDALEAYNPRNDTWSARKAMPSARSWVAGAVAGDSLYVIGGYRFANDRVTDRVDIYRPATDRWTEGKDMPTSRAILSAVELGGTIYAIGGIDAGKKAVTAVEAYDPKADAWKKLAPLPVARFGAAVAAYQGKIYVFGGREKFGGPRMASVDVYDPAKNAWSAVKPLPERLSHATAIPTADGIYVAGGVNKTNHRVNLVRVYDPAKDRWKRAKDLRLPRYGAAGIIIDGKAILIGGGDADDHALGLTQVLAP